jgi:hypothetical protein
MAHHRTDNSGTRRRWPDDPRAGDHRRRLARPPARQVHGHHGRSLRPLFGRRSPTRRILHRGDRMAMGVLDEHPTGVLAITSAVFFLRLPKIDHDKPKLDVTGMVLLALASTDIIVLTTWGGTTYTWNPHEHRPDHRNRRRGPRSCPCRNISRGTDHAATPFRRPQLQLHHHRRTHHRSLQVRRTGHLPTYLQMVTGAGATQAGLLVTSIVSGQLVSKTG